MYLIYGLFVSGIHTQVKTAFLGLGTVFVGGRVTGNAKWPAGLIHVPDYAVASTYSSAEAPLIFEEATQVFQEIRNLEHWNLIWVY